MPEGLVLGVMPESAYRTLTVNLAPGDSLLLYTDGVTESMNRDRQLYSDERLLDNVRATRERAPRAQVERILQTVREHAGDAAQSDDITVLSLLYRGNPVPSRDPADEGKATVESAGNGRPVRGR